MIFLFIIKIIIDCINVFFYLNTRGVDFIGNYYINFNIIYYSSNIAGLKHDKMIELVHLMGRIYDHDIEGQEQFTTLQNVLDTFDVDNATGMYDIAEHMQAVKIIFF